jgi:hypothetical protein
LRRRQLGRTGPVDADADRYERADGDAFGTVVAGTEFLNSNNDTEPRADRNAQRFRNADAHSNA